MDRHVDLWVTQITDSGLVAVERMTNVQSLQLDGTRIGDVGLARLPSLKKLELLQIGATRVSDAGVTELQRGLPHVGISR